MKEIKKIINLGTTGFSGFLWHLGGTICKAYRRYEVAFLIGGVIYFKTKNIIISLLTFLICFFSFSIGYGIPDYSDDGCIIARLIKKPFPNISHNILMFFTRLIISILYFISGFIITYYTKQYINILYLILGILSIPILCLFRLNVKLEEPLIGSIILLIYILLK